MTPSTTPFDSNSPRRCLVTGATGFIGSRLVERLLALGHHVRVACRKTSDRKWLADVDGRYESCIADLTDRDALERAIADCQWVFHVGGLTTAPDWPTFERVNGEGTANVFAAACTAAAGTLERFVYVSSLSAVGPAASPRDPRTEDDDCRPVSMYGASKLRGEARIRELADADRERSGRRWPWVVLRPSVVYGPRDVAVLEFFRLLKRRVRPTLGCPALWISLIHVDDLIDAALAVATADAEAVIEQAFHVCDGERYPFAAVMRRIQRHIGRSAVLPLRVPLTALFLQARVAGLAGRLFRFTPELTVDKCRELAGRYWLSDAGKIQARTGWSARTPLDRGLAETADWYRAHGWI